MDNEEEKNNAPENNQDELDTGYEAFWNSNQEQKKEEVKEEEKPQEEEKEKKVTLAPEKSVEQIVSETVRQQAELSDYLVSHPELAPFKETIRKVASESRMRGVKVESIVGAAIGVDNAMRLGAKLFQNKKEEVETNKPVGQTARETEEGSTQIKPYNELTPEEKDAFRRKYRVS